MPYSITLASLRVRFDVTSPTQEILSELVKAMDVAGLRAFLEQQKENSLLDHAMHLKVECARSAAIARLCVRSNVHSGLFLTIT